MKSNRIIIIIIKIIIIYHDDKDNITIEIRLNYKKDMKNKNMEMKIR